MEQAGTWGRRIAAFGIAALCFGYFASYVPYTMMTKLVTKGLCCGLGGTGLTGFQIQPIAIFASFVCMYSFITIMGWWKHTTHSKILGISVPRPQWFTLLSGLSLSFQIITTTLAYTFGGISIVFAMLLMRGGVLIMAPVVDMIVKRRKRKIYWPSWVAAALSLAAVIVAISGKMGTNLTLIAGIDISIYLLAYFFRLVLMSSWAKSSDEEERKRFFSEEQMVANAALFTGLFIVAFLGRNSGSEPILGQLWNGFAQIPFQGFFLFIFFLGFFSYGTGLFGSLIYLDGRENTFTVPANRASSILAGVLADYLLAFFYGQRFPSVNELAGAALIITAIAFLGYRSVVEKRTKAAKRAQIQAQIEALQTA
ncbi:MAG: hypothetical protein WC956_02045 [bacterium]